MRTVTVSHNWYSFLRCSGIAVPTVFGVPSDVSCQDQGRVCRAWSGLVRTEAELGHSLTATQSWTCMILLLEILYFHTSTAMELMLSESVHLQQKGGVS